MNDHKSLTHCKSVRYIKLATRTQKRKWAIITFLSYKDWIHMRSYCGVSSVNCYCINHMSYRVSICIVSIVKWSYCIAKSVRTTLKVIAPAGFWLRGQTRGGIMMLCLTWLPFNQKELTSVSIMPQMSTIIVRLEYDFSSCIKMDFKIKDKSGRLVACGKQVYYHNCMFE